MRILVFLSHPAQFFFYKNMILNLNNTNHKVFVLVKSKDILTKLLDEQNIDYYNILPKKRGESTLEIIRSLIIRDFKILKFGITNKIDIYMGSDASLAHVARLTGRPCITTLEDDFDVIKNLAKLTYPFTNQILAPSICKVGKWQHKKIGYDGYMKLAYLHPNWFTPCRDKVHLSSNRYFLIRLSGLKAHHDKGIKGISDKLLDQIIQKLSPYGHVYISSEIQLPVKYKMFELNCNISNIHHYLFYADIIICDSQSMSVESAVLGTPSIRISSFKGRISVLEELEEKYNLTFGFQPNEVTNILNQIDQLLKYPNLKNEFALRRKKMLSDKIDVTAFLLWIIEDYPESVRIMKEKPNYQYNFK